jgi:hypothetical protein
VLPIVNPAVKIYSYDGRGYTQTIAAMRRREKTPAQVAVADIKEILRRALTAVAQDKWSWLKEATPLAKEMPSEEEKAWVWQPGLKELNEHKADLALWEECCALRDEMQADEPLFAVSATAQSYGSRLATVRRVTLRGWDFRGPSHFAQIAKNLKEYSAKAARTAKVQAAKPLCEVQETRPIESAMGRLLYGEHNGAEWEMSPAHLKRVAIMSYEKALRYAKAHRRWITERAMSTNGDFRSFNEILEESRTFPQ